jgi:hypothetical protein
VDAIVKTFDSFAKNDNLEQTLTDLLADYMEASGVSMKSLEDIESMSDEELKQYLEDNGIDPSWF